MASLRGESIVKPRDFQSPDIEANNGLRVEENNIQHEEDPGSFVDRTNGNRADRSVTLNNNSNRFSTGNVSNRSRNMSRISTMNHGNSGHLGTVKGVQKDVPHGGEARYVSDQADIFLKNFKMFFYTNFIGDGLSQVERESLEAKVKRIRDGDYDTIDYKGFSFTPLYWAVLMDDLETVHGILKADTVGVDFDHGYGYNPILHLAVGCGNSEIVKALLPYITDVNRLNSSGSTAFHRAVECGHVAVVDVLLSDTRLNVNEKDAEGKTVLHRAVEYGDFHMVKAVLMSESVEVDVWAIDNAWNTALHLAVEREKIDMVTKLLEYQPIVQVGILYFKDVRFISKNKLGQSALHVALKKQNVEIVRQLLSLALNINFTQANDPDTSFTALHWAVKFTIADINDLENRLEKLGFDIGSDMQSAFILGDIDVVRGVILEGNVNVHAKDIDGRTALHMAVEGGNIDIIREFLEHKDRSKLTQEPWNEKNPIEIAYEMQHHDIERVLMECDAVSRSIEHLYRDRQVYVDAANAILVGAALIASVTFASWLQPPLSYTTSYKGGEDKYVNVENNTGLRTFWIFNCLAFYFATATVVFGACSVLPRRNLYIKQIVQRLRLNLFITSILLTLSVFFVIIAFAIAGCIVLPPMLKFQWFMIGPSILGGAVCLIGLGVLGINIWEDRRLGKRRKYVSRDDASLKRNSRTSFVGKNRTN